MPDAVVKEYEQEIVRLSDSLRQAYDTHATSVAKFEKDIALLKRELQASYQHGAKLTREKVRLTGEGSDAAKNTAELEEQVRRLKKELEYANKGRKKAEEESITAAKESSELRAMIEASENVATKSGRNDN